MIRCRIDKPRVLVLPVTYRCNARCKMCSIWESSPGSELSIEDYAKVFQDPLLSGAVEFVNITGGECFLRNDLVDLVRLLAEKCPSLISIGIASNGFMTQRIVAMIEKMISAILPTDILLSIGLSFDGIGEIHDKTRGVPGGYEKMIVTLKELKRLEKIYWPKFGVGVGTNINAISADSVRETHCYLKENGIPYYYTPVVTSDLFFKNLENRDEFELTPLQRTDILNFYRELRQAGDIDSFYYKFVTDWIGTRKRSVGCIFQTSGIFLEPNGDVYPCKTFKSYKLGNVLESAFSDIWTVELLKPVYREMLRHCRSCGCNCFIEKASCLSKCKRILYRYLFH